MCPTDQCDFYMTQTLEGTIRQKTGAANFLKNKEIYTHVHLDLESTYF